jgi:hypothetical protein
VNATELQITTAAMVFRPWFDRWAPDFYEHDEAGREFATALIAFLKMVPS